MCAGLSSGDDSGVEQREIKVVWCGEGGYLYRHFNNYLMGMVEELEGAQLWVVKSVGVRHFCR